ncbi:hypothetical protein RND81_08G054600 [Saponaria officinalis]|uniref:Glycoside hydrolase family 38 N-terminal domain-containing protein n=1 Tax=Saponaria officinalis TaxID=3572 RepID=A0AAW1J2T2_SAPOF
MLPVLIQGSRLTAFELVHEKIPATLIADSAAAALMKDGRVHGVIVGSRELFLLVPLFVDSRKYEYYFNILIDTLADFIRRLGTLIPPNNHRINHHISDKIKTPPKTTKTRTTPQLHTLTLLLPHLLPPHHHSHTLPLSLSSTSSSSFAIVDITTKDPYDRIEFFDVDGGAWKQVWSVAYKGNEWDHEKLKIVVVPHSHNDPGWKLTVDEYYDRQSRHILDTIVES